MWYLIVNDNSERYFIKEKIESVVYFSKENSNNIEEKTLKELQDNHFRIVGEAYSSEIEKLEELLKV